LKNRLKLIFVIIGALIGAGFASGQEINLFFFSYGLKGIIGIFISSIVMGLIIDLSLRIIKDEEVENYEQFLAVLLPRKGIGKIIKPIVNWVINGFIAVTFMIMIAGFGAYLKQEFGIPSYIGSTILAVICWWILQKQSQGVVKASGLIVPFLIAFITIVGIANLPNLHWQELDHYIVQTNSTNWLMSGLLYSSYNSILLIPVLITLKNYLKKEKHISIITIITTLVVISLAFLVYTLLIPIEIDISKVEMPAVYLISQAFPSLKLAYGFVLLAAIFTTAISLGNSFLQNISKQPKSYPQLVTILCIISVGVSQFGFSNLVNYLYPIFGYLGFFQILIICVKNIAKKRKNWYNIGNKR
jgi:uncharacterized membrane protein YkvI